MISFTWYVICFLTCPVPSGTGTADTSIIVLKKLECCWPRLLAILWESVRTSALNIVIIATATQACQPNTWSCMIGSVIMPHSLRLGPDS